MDVAPHSTSTWLGLQFFIVNVQDVASALSNIVKYFCLILLYDATIHKIHWDDAVALYWGVDEICRLSDHEKFDPAKLSHLQSSNSVF